jgi:hypothetical protein
MILDGAHVIAVSQKADFGFIKYIDNSIEAIQVKYLAICKYEKSDNIYLFLCDENMEVEQDDLFDSIEDAKKRATEMNEKVVWEYFDEF